jgi:hypothetical protein
MEALFGAIVGAGATLIATWFTLRHASDQEQARWERERVARDIADRRAVYARFIRAATLWRESTVDLEGKPGKREWADYWAARVPALEAGSELLVAAPAEALEPASEALDVLLDAWWDFEVNGPRTLERDWLWGRISSFDAYMDEFRDVARREFGVAPVLLGIATRKAAVDNKEPPAG